MTPAEQVERYFWGTTAQSDHIGAEVETSFITSGGIPISLDVSQRIMRDLVNNGGWRVGDTKNDGEFIATVVSPFGDVLSYELGRQNLELATVPVDPAGLIAHTRKQLDVVYRVAAKHDAYPHFAPILDTNEDLLALPDKRDVTWLTLDGRSALRPLATISSVQFTLPVTVDTAIPILNRFGAQVAEFLADYPQEDVWYQYVAESSAGYRSDRYGGPSHFESLADYCQQLVQHDVVVDTKLVPMAQVDTLDIPLFLRSVWWYSRLRKHGDQLCVEVRPLPRRGDDQLDHQLQRVLAVARG